jgi:hypothetical protein
MPTPSVKSSSRLWQRIARLSTLGLGVGSLLGGFTVLATVTPAGASGNLYVATTGSDAGGNTCTNKATPCLTLKHAYSEASAGNTINLGPGTFAGGIYITKNNLDIVGTAPGGSLEATNTTISGGSPVLENHATQLTISNVVITGSESFTGGGIWNYDDLTLTNVTVENNNGYGGIYNAGDLTMTGGSITENMLNNGGYIGGGLENYDSAVLQDVVLTHNSAAESYGEGGAIGNDGYLKLIGTAVHNNSAGLDGGGIEECSKATLTLQSGTSISANTPNQIGTTDPDGTC